MGDIIFDIGFNQRSITKSVSDLRRTISRGLGSIFTGGGAGAKANKGAQKFGTDMVKTFSLAAKAVAKYVLGLRSMFFMYRKLRAAAIESMKSLGEYSKEVEQDLNRISASISAAKYSLATAFQPILPYLASIISKIMSMLQALAKAVGTVFAVITGQNFLWQAKVNTEQFTDSLGGATDAAKKLKRALAPFDDINVLPDNDDDAGGGGGGSGDDGDLLGWEQVPLDEKVKAFVDALKEMIEQGDWEGVGKLLADKVNQGLDKLYQAISWENVGPKVEDFIDKFSRTFNSFIENLNFYRMGQIAGEAINDVANAFNLLYEKIEWENLGKKIGDGFLGLIDQINWENLGNYMGAKFMLAWKIFGGFLDKMSEEDGAGLTGWDKLGEGIGDAIMGVFDNKRGINLTEIANSIADLLNGAFDLAISTGVTIDFKKLGTKVADALTEFFSTLDTEDIANAVNTWVLGILEFISTTLEETEWDKIGEDIADLLTNIDWSGILEGVFKTLVDVLGAALDVLKGFADAAPAFSTAMSVFLGSFVGYEVLTHVTTTFTALTTAIQTATTAGLASSLGILGVAIGGFFGALVALDLTTSVVNVDYINEMAEALGQSKWEDARTNMDDMTKSIHDFIEENSDLTANADADSKKIDILRDAYFKLADKENKTAAEQYELKKTAEELIALVPGLSGVIDPVTGSYNGQKDAIYELIDAQKAYLQVSAYSEALKDYNDRIVDGKVQLMEQSVVLSDLKQKQSDLAELAMKTNRDSTLSWEEQQQALQAFNDEYGTSLSSWEDATDLLGSVDDEVEKTQESYDALSDAVKSLEKQKEGFLKQMEEEQKAYADTKQAQEELDYANLVLKQSEAIDQMHGIWSDGKQLLGQDALDAYKEIEAGLTPDENGMYTLANGMMVQYGQGLEDGGASAIETLGSGFLTDLNNTLMAQGKTIAEENGKLVIQDLVSTIETEADTYLTPAGATAIAKFIEGSDSVSPELKKSFEGYAEMSTDALIEKINNAGPEMQTVMNTLMEQGMLHPTENGLELVEARWNTAHDNVAETTDNIVTDVSTNNQRLIENTELTNQTIEEMKQRSNQNLLNAQNQFNQDTLDNTDWEHKELLGKQDAFNIDTETKNADHQSKEKGEYQKHLDEMISKAKTYQDESLKEVEEGNAAQTESFNKYHEEVSTSTEETFTNMKDTIVTNTTEATDEMSSKIGDNIEIVKTEFGELEISADTGFGNMHIKISGWVGKIGSMLADFAKSALETVSDIFRSIDDASNAQNTLSGMTTSGGPGGPASAIANYRALTKVAEVPIPKLATGAVIPPNRRFLAELGDQRQGTNVEAPLDTIKQALAEVMAQYMGSMQSQSAEMTLDGQTFARLEVPYVLDELRRSGYNVQILEE